MCSSGVLGNCSSDILAAAAAVARSTLERFARSTLERSQHTKPCRSSAGEMAPRALARGSQGLGGCGCGGAPSRGGCRGLGLGLGAGSDAVHQSCIRPLVGRRRVKPPDLHDRRPGRRPRPDPPRKLHPPKSMRLPTHGGESPVAGPPLFHLGGEEVELGQLKHLDPLFPRGGRSPPIPPRQLRLPPPPPSDPPHPQGVVQVDDPLPPRPPIPTSPAPKYFDAPDQSIKSLADMLLMLKIPFEGSLHVALALLNSMASLPHGTCDHGPAVHNSRHVQACKQPCHALRLHTGLPVDGTPLRPDTPSAPSIRQDPPPITVLIMTMF